VAKCTVQLSRPIVLGGRKIRHVMPTVHVQRLTHADVAEEMREQEFLANSFGRGWKDDPGFGTFRVDFGRRVLGGFTATRAADYLEANAKVWPEHDFASEIRYFRAKARGDRICQDCGELLPAIPVCDCGCQSPPKPVAGWGLMAATVKPSPANGSLAPLTAEAIPPGQVRKPQESLVLGAPSHSGQSGGYEVAGVDLAAPGTESESVRQSVELSATPGPSADIVTGGPATREEPDDDANPF